MAVDREIERILRLYPDDCLPASAELTLLGLISGALGCWIVLAGRSYSAESLAHAMLPGLVVAALLGVPLLLGGAAGLLVGAVLIALAGRIPPPDRRVPLVAEADIGTAGFLKRIATAGRVLYGQYLGSPAS